MFAKTKKKPTKYCEKKKKSNQLHPHLRDSHPQKKSKNANIAPEEERGFYPRMMKGKSHLE